MDLLIDVSMRQEYHNPHEFYFSIEIISIDGTYEDLSTQDRNIVRAYLGNDLASKVMPVVLRGLDALVTRCSPPIIYRVTKIRQPPAKALRKHDLVTFQLESLGYRILVCDMDVMGRAYWIMERTR